MQEVRIKLETVTPMFLGGANAKTAPPELRGPAFKSAMRYWFRATLGGVIGDNNLDGLHALESMVFGSTDYGSPISVQLIGNLKYSQNSILPHKNNTGRRNAFNDTQDFELVLRCRTGTSDLVWENACMSLNVALLFGGMGLRSRRGFGSLRVYETTNSKLIYTTPDKLKNLEGRITKILETALSAAGKLATYQKIPITSLPSSPTTYPCAAQDGIVRMVQIGGGSPEKILTSMMSVMPHDKYLGGINPRQSSPLWIRVFWLDDQYHLLLCVLPSMLKNNVQNYTEVTNFLKTNFPGKDMLIKGWNTL